MSSSKSLVCTPYQRGEFKKSMHEWKETTNNNIWNNLLHVQSPYPTSPIKTKKGRQRRSTPQKIYWDTKQLTQSTISQNENTSHLISFRPDHAAQLQQKRHHNIRWRSHVWARCKLSIRLITHYLHSHARVTLENFSPHNSHLLPFSLPIVYLFTSHPL